MTQLDDVLEKARKNRQMGREEAQRRGWVVKPITWAKELKGYCCQCNMQCGFSHSEFRCTNCDNHVFCGQCTGIDGELEQ